MPTDRREVIMDAYSESSLVDVADAGPPACHVLRDGGCSTFQRLRDAGLRPTRQRLLLADLLFGQGHRHVTAEMLFAESAEANIQLSLATVYNTLNQLTDAGLLRQVSVDGTKTYFDTNVTTHHHYYLENSHELVDIEDPHLVLSKMPEVPEGYEISRIDMVVRLRKKR
jgi:Fur family iron response transcriptional regulator